MSQTQAKNKRDAASRKMEQAVKSLAALMLDPTDRSPSIQALERKSATAKAAWDLFEEMNWAYEGGSGEVEDEETVERERYLQEKTNLYEKEQDKAEEMLRRMKVPEEIVRSVEELVESLKEDLEVEKAAALRILRRVEEGLAAGDHNELSVKTLREDLEQSKTRNVQSKVLCGKLKEMDPASKEYVKLIFKEIDTTYSDELQMIMRRLNQEDFKIKEASGSRRRVEEESTEGRVRVEANTTPANYFQRRAFPTFSGEMRDYHGFKKEWMSCIASKFDEDFQLREIRKAVPKVFEPEIKNLNAMKDVWETLDEEYAREGEFGNILIQEVTNFKPSAEARTESDQFLEFHKKWSQVKADLTEVNQVGLLDYGPTLSILEKILPAASKDKYVDFKMEEQEKGRAANDVFTSFMIKERSRQKSRKRMEKDGEVIEEAIKGKGEAGKCFICGGSGHRKADCKSGGVGGQTTKSGGVGGQTTKSGGWGQHIMAHASMRRPQKPCSVCGGQHTYVNADGTTMYMSRLAHCPEFVKLSLQERGAMIKNAGGCTLCLDWTGEHSKESCKSRRRGEGYPSCDMEENGVLCGRMHHRMLHGVEGLFCNLVQANAVRTRQAPTMEDVKRLDAARNVLMQIQWIEVGDVRGKSVGWKLTGGDGTCRELTGGDGKCNYEVGWRGNCLVFWDTGSNINLVRKKFVEKLGLEGTPVTQYLQTTGRGSEAWHTMAYWIPLVDTVGDEHKFLAFEMGTITAAQESVDVSGAMQLFPALQELSQIRRPEGEVDLLVGVQHAPLHPRLESEENVVQSLRLLTSQFGTGYVLDGVHSGIAPQPLLVHPDVLAKGHSVVGQQIFQGQEGRKIRLVNKIEAVFNFHESEEMMTSQPRRCGTCSGCKKCGVRAVEMTKKEQLELALIEDNIHVDIEKRIVTFKYPLIKNPGALGDNKRQATAMAAGSEKKLKAKGEMGAYNDELLGYIDRGVIRRISEEEMRRWGTRPFNYISHHGVVKPGSVTTKLRVVSNSSLNNNNSGLSYNDCLPKGPNSLIPLVQSLITWRGYEEVVVWDIRKAYNGLHTFEDELHMRRLVWRWGESDQPWTTYGFMRMAFGDRVGTCGLEVAKKKIAEEGMRIDEQVARMVAGGYVDDGCGGGDKSMVDRLVGKQTGEAGKYQYDGKVSEILALGGMSPKVMVKSGEEDEEVIRLLGGGVLGLPWNPRRDVITFHMGVNLSAKVAKNRTGPGVGVGDLEQIEKVVVTRRVIVSQVYGVYDPLGLMAPITIKFRMLLQRVTKQNREDNVEAGWDTPIEGLLGRQCREMLKEIVVMEDVEFPRSVKGSNMRGRPAIVGWWDGGEPAAAAVVYLRYQREEVGTSGETHQARLVSAKARVNPSSGPVSTPRSEMRGLLMLVRMITAVLPGLPEAPARISLFGDSECTITSVDCEEHRLNMWFGNRVAEVEEHMNGWKEQEITVDKLHHWPGVRNIADIATKGKAELKDVIGGSEWQEGPWEIRFPRANWPATRTFKRVVPEEEKRGKIFNVNAVGRSTSNEPPALLGWIEEMMIRHSSMNTVRGSVARFLRSSVKRRREEAREEPNTKYLELAEKLIFVVGSSATDAAVKKGLVDGLSPMWTKGRWVTRGRLGKGVFKVLGVSELVILLPDSRLATLLMQQAHKEDHRGAKITLWRSRTQAWVWRGLKVAERIVKACIWCRAKRAKLCEQRIGDVPEDRLEVGSPPFTWVSLDLMGPILVKSMVKSRTMMKVWPLLIVCKSTGALHTLVMHDYGTNAFLLQWSQFVALRGAPMTVTSDRGSQLTSVDNVVRWEQIEDPRGWGWKEIEAVTARGGTKWVFIPAGCQWRNGLAESRVKAMKNTLGHMMTSTIIGTKATVSYVELTVILSRASSIINDRPIGVKSLTRHDAVAITPNQLLIGQTGTSMREAREEEVQNYGRSSRYQEELLNVWWQMWSVQIFPHLAPYPTHKAAHKVKNLAKGDVCMLRYDGKIKSSYRLCRVGNVWPDEIGVVRTVEVTFREKGKIGKTGKTERLVVGVQRLVLIQEQEELKEMTEEDEDVESVVD